MDGVAAIWIGVAFTAAIQLGGVAFWVGSLSQRVKGLRDDLEEHTEAPVGKSHACPLLHYTEEHRSEKD